MKNSILLLLIAGCTTLHAQWQPYGQILTGENSGDFYGQDIALSADGKTLLSGVMGSEDFGIGAINNFPRGKMQVSEYVNDSWVPLGNDIGGGNSMILFGNIVALSANGKVVAGYGLPETNDAFINIYELVNSEWVLKGNPIELIYNVADISLNQDGSILAVGNSRNGTLQPGSVDVYRFENNQWQLLGAPIIGEDPANGLSRVALSNDGLTMVTGDPTFGTNGTTTAMNRGMARVFTFNGTSWVQVGSDIIGVNNPDKLGLDVSINNIGDRIGLIAASSTNNDEVKVFEFINGDWQQVGNTILPHSSSSIQLSSCELNGAGDVIMIGDHYSDGVGGVNVGIIRALQLIGSNWVEINEPIEGVAADDLFGVEIAIDDSGGLIAGSSYRNNQSRGHIRLFAETTLGIQTFESDNPTVLLHPNPSSGIVTLESLDSPMLSYTIFNTNGQIVKSNSNLKNEQSDTVDLSSMAKGLYFAQVATTSQIIQVKFILE